MSTTYVLSQILVVVAYVFLVLTYATKNRKILLMFSFGYLTVLSISLLLLEAYTGLAMNVFAILRNIVFLIQNKDKNAKYTTVDYLILAILLVVLCAFAGFTYKGIFSLLSPLSTICYTVSVWQRSIPVYKILGIPTSVLFLLYNVYIGSLFGIICEGVFLVIVIIENILYFTKRKKEIEQPALKAETVVETNEQTV